MKNVFACITLFLGTTLSFGQTTPDYATEFDFFVIALGFDDSTTVRSYFESDSAYQANVWDIFEPEFVKALATYKYSDLKPSETAGTEFMELVLQYSWTDTDLEGNPMSGTTTIYVYFKETPTGLKFIETFRPEGTDAP